MGGLQPWHWMILLFVVAVIGGGIALVVALASRSKPRPQLPQSQGVAPGWYPDPRDPTALRYFDGQNWVSGPPR